MGRVSSSRVSCTEQVKGDDDVRSLWNGVAAHLVVAISTNMTASQW